MKIIICGGTGFIGRNLIPALLKNQHEITVVGRNINKIEQIFKRSINALSWDELNQLNPDEFEAVINLAGHNIADKRWTDKNKKHIKESRVNSTNKIIDWCMTSKKRKIHLYNASAIGTYGLQPIQDTLPPPFNESQQFTLSKPTDFLSDVGHAWENATDKAVASGYPVTLMRFAVVLKRKEGMLKKLELPFSLGLGSILGNGKQALTWIHIDDLVNAILFLLNHPDVTGPVNICAPGCVSQKIFAKTLANIMHRPLILKMPSVVINILFGQMGKELLLGSQNVYPEKLKQLEFDFIFPDLKSALTHEWDNSSYK